MKMFTFPGKQEYLTLDLGEMNLGWVAVAKKGPAKTTSD